MKRLIVLIVAAVCLCPAALPAFQKMKIVRQGGPGGMTTKEFSQDEILSVPELSAMILEQDKAIVVEHIMEKEMRMKGYESTDLQEGDKILMANGKKMGSLKELRELYATAAPGSTVKFGVKRNDDMVIASFVKADPKDLPKTRMIVAGGPDKEIIGIPEVGLVFSNKGKDVVVEHVLDNAAKELNGADIKEGDLITALNTFPVKSFADFQKRFKSIPVGDKVEIVASRGGKTATVTFSKPKDDGKVIIRR